MQVSIHQPFSSKEAHALNKVEYSLRGHTYKFTRDIVSPKIYKVTKQIPTLHCYTMLMEMDHSNDTMIILLRNGNYRINSASL